MYYSLKENKIGPKGAHHLAPALSALTELSTLEYVFNVSLNFFSDPGTSLSKNSIGENGMQVLAPALEKLIDLNYLGYAYQPCLLSKVFTPPIQIE